MDSLNDATLLGREQVAATYLGARVRWELTLWSLNKLFVGAWATRCGPRPADLQADDEVIAVYAETSPGKTVWAYVLLRNNPQLKYLKQGALITIEGDIGEVRSREVTLFDAHVTPR